MFQEMFLAPKEVPDTAAPALAEGERTFTHSSHGAQGGEAGNDYQAYWITLAALNAVASNASVNELILEGDVEPYDDVQVRYTDGTLTLFQSKHRDQKGSNNIQISELIALPSGDSRSKPFSLAKYFKSMMEYINNGSDLAKARFIICVSASFSQTFEKPSKAKEAKCKDEKPKKERVTLEVNTWTTAVGGILVALEEARLDSLFSAIHKKNKAPEQFSEMLDNEAEYVRFSDDFIEGQGLTENQTLLRTMIFDAIKNHVDKESNQGWVTSDIKEHTEGKIKLFLKNLQLWIKQPKLKKLKQLTDKAAQALFTTDVEDIHTFFYERMKATSARDKPSLDLKQVEAFLREARGKVLVRQLLTHGNKFMQDNQLEFLRSGICDKELADFLKLDGAPLMLAQGKHTDSLKHQMYSLVRAAEFGSVANDWCVIAAQTPPLYYVDTIAGPVELGCQDMFRAGTLKLLIIDGAEAYLDSDYGKALLGLLATQTHCKVILLTDNARGSDLKQALPPATLELSLTAKLTQDDISKKLRASKITGKQIKLLFGVHVPIAKLAECPTWQATLALPHICQSLLEQASEVVAAPSSNPSSNFRVARYTVKPMPRAKPYYHLNDLVKCLPGCCIRIRNLNNPQKAFLKEKFRDSSECGKGKDLYINKGKEGGSYLHVKMISSEIGFNVKLTHSRKDEDADLEVHNGLLPAVPAAGFLKTEKLESIADYRTLLSKSVYDTATPARTLVAADYGAGKSSLLNQLFTHFLETPAHDRLYDLVIPCHLTQITSLVEEGRNLENILIAELLRQKLLDPVCLIWFRAYLLELLKTDKILILFDKWDELHKAHYKMMSQWLFDIPQRVHYLVASRWHAVPALNVGIQCRIELGLFVWADIKRYVVDFFDGRETQLSAEKQGQFKKELLAWLGNGKAAAVNDILKRPLHLTLLVEALEPFYDDLVKVNKDQEAYAVNAESPWKDKILYRLKLYQLIVFQQFKKYIFEHVGAKPITTGVTDMRRVNFFTQAHQLRLREIAFSLNFDEKPIVLMNACDEELLLDELYQLGILKGSAGDAPEFLYRIFSEYFTAQYLLAALLREVGDPVYEFVRGIIQKHANNDKYQEIFQILGEMIRYGESFLAYKAQGAHTNPLSIFPDLVSDDMLGFYYTTLSAYLRGISAQDKYEIKLASGFGDPKPNDFSDSLISEDHQGKTPQTLLEEAKSKKQEAATIVSHMVASGEIHEAWLERFYHKDKIDKQKVAEEKADDSSEDLIRDIKALREKVDNFNWPEASWGGYWDIDAFLPAVKYMHPRLFLMGAAYFIHRIENRNNTYYEYGLPQPAYNVLYHLALASLQDKSDIGFYFMMLLSWLKKPRLVNAADLKEGFFTGIIDKAVELFDSGNNFNRSLAAYTLFALFGVFKIRVYIDDASATFATLQLKGVTSNTIYVVNLAKEMSDFIEVYFTYQKNVFSGKPFEMNDFKFEENAFCLPEGELDEVRSAIAAKKQDVSERTKVNDRDRGRYRDIHASSSPRIAGRKPGFFSGSGSSKSKGGNDAYQDFLKKANELGYVENGEATKKSLRGETAKTGGQLKALQEQTKKFGFTCQDVPGDGNCFFHAVLQQLTQCKFDLAPFHVTDHKGLREKALDHILHNFELYRDIAESEGGYNAFIGKLMQDGEWADHIVIQSVSRLLNITIVLFRSDGAEPTVFRRHAPAATIYLGYEAGWHYQSTVPDASSAACSDAVNDIIQKANVDSFGVPSVMGLHA